MPWIRAELRGKEVYARAREDGRLLEEGGRVEIRYAPRDGRKYRAAARNLSIVNATVLPDDTCAEAETVAGGAAKKKTGGSKKAGGSKGASKKRETPEQSSFPTVPSDGVLVAYTDGACSGNPGPAGLGVVILEEDRRVERFEYLGEATNNVAELTAILRAIAEIGDRPAVVYTDSRYAIGVLQKGWKAKANKALISELREALETNGSLTLAYVPGHAGIDMNERADELARRAVTDRTSMRREVKSGPD